MCLKVLLVLSSVLLLSKSFKILALFPHPRKSHLDVFLPLTKALAKKGHEITVLSHYPLENPLPNYTDISLGNASEHLLNVINLNDFQNQERVKWFINLRPHSEYLTKIFCESSIETNDILDKFMKTNHSFDLIIAEFFNNDCFLGFVDKFKAPLIGITSSTMLPWTSARFGNPTHPAYIPNNFLGFSDRMKFFQRVENVVVGLIHQITYDYFTLKQDEKIARKYFGDESLSLKKIIYDSSLYLVNSHFSLNLPRPLVPAIIEVAGIHLSEPKKLSKNLEKWINDAPDGVIYFSLGSMIKGHTFPEGKRREFLKAFGRLPQRVLWKWENESMPGKPDNVMIQKWMPQLDILCHPNVKAFISHGGLLGTVEAVHCGVPAVVMPQFGDQHTNARALEANGGGVILQLHEADEEKIYKALKTVLDPKFRKGAQELSARFRDRPLPPLETAIYWVEYVARHRGAHHMRTAAVDMPLYKYLLLDVIAFLLLVFGVAFAIFFHIARYIWRKLSGKGQKQKTN